MCDSEDDYLATKNYLIQSQTDASIQFSDHNEMEFTEYNSKEKLTTTYELRYDIEPKITENNSLEEMSTTYEPGFHKSTSKGIDSSHMLNNNDNRGHGSKKNILIIASVISVVLLLMVLILLCNRKFVAWIRRRQISESDNSVLPLFHNIMEEISLEYQE